MKQGHATELTARSGDIITLSAEGTTDPDGDALSYEWFYYGEAGTLTTSSGRTGQPVAIKNFDQKVASFTVPSDRVMAPGTGTMHRHRHRHHAQAPCTGTGTGTGTMHIILAVTDHGTPRLTRYGRVIVDVTE